MTAALLLGSNILVPAGAHKTPAGASTEQAERRSDSPLRCRRGPAVHSERSRTPRASRPGPARHAELGCSQTCRRSSCLSGRRERPTTVERGRPDEEDEADPEPAGQMKDGSGSLQVMFEERLLRVNPHFYPQCTSGFTLPKVASSHSISVLQKPSELKTLNTEPGGSTETPPTPRVQY